MFAAHGAGMVPPMLPLPPAGMYGAMIHRPDDISDSDEESCDEGSGEIDVHKELAALTPKKWKTLRKKFANCAKASDESTDTHQHQYFPFSCSYSEIVKMQKSWEANAMTKCLGGRRPDRPKCREWQASGTCKFGDKCWFFHNLDNECALSHDGDDSVEQLKVHVENASSPLGLSASGKLIRVGCSNPEVVLQIFDEPAVLKRQHFLLNGSKSYSQLSMSMIQSRNYREFDSDSHKKMYLRRLLRVLLQPLFPKCADDIAFGLGPDVCPDLNAQRIGGRFPIMSCTSIKFRKLRSLFFNEDFDYDRFRTSIRRHVANVAAATAAADNAWLRTHLLECPTKVSSWKYPRNVRQLDTTNLELEIHRLSAIRSIMLQCEPQFASRLANTFFLRFEPEYLDRLIQSPLTYDMKFKIALSELEKRSPNEAEILKFHMEYCRSACTQKGRAAAPGGGSCIAMSIGDSKQVLSEAMRDPFVSCAAFSGALGRLPVWLQGLPCTTAVNEDGPIHVTCRVPTKVYMLSIGPQSVNNRKHSACAPAWTSSGTETCAFLPAKYIWSEISEQFYMNPFGSSRKTIELAPKLQAIGDWVESLKDMKYRSDWEKSKLRHNVFSGNLFDSSSACDGDVQILTSSVDIFSTILQPGTHALDTSDAVYFFDTEHHARQKLLQSSGVALCAHFQRSGTCCAGDRCTYSHIPPLFFNPDIPVYIGHMLLQCRKQLCAKLCLPIVKSMNVIHSHRSKLHSKHSDTSHWFPARRRVHCSALLAELALRLMGPASYRQGNCKAVDEAVAHALPLRVYRGLRWRAADVDNNPYAFIEHKGYVFRTLSNRMHSQYKLRLDSGATFFVWGRQYEGDKHVSRELPMGYEICPPDAASIDACSMYEWQSWSLTLGDGRAYSTDVEPMDDPRLPLKDFCADLKVEGRVVTVERGDVLIRRRCWSCL